MQKGLYYRPRSVHTDPLGNPALTKKFVPLKKQHFMSRTNIAIGKILIFQYYIGEGGRLFVDCILGLESTTVLYESLYNLDRYLGIENL